MSCVSKHVLHCYITTNISKYIYCKLKHDKIKHRIFWKFVALLSVNTLPCQRNSSTWFHQAGATKKKCAEVDTVQQGNLRHTPNHVDEAWFPSQLPNVSLRFQTCRWWSPRAPPTWAERTEGTPKQAVMKTDANITATPESTLSLIYEKWGQLTGLRRACTDVSSLMIVFFIGILVVAEFASKNIRGSWHRAVLALWIKCVCVCGHDRSTHPAYQLDPHRNPHHHHHHRHFCCRHQEMPSSIIMHY